MWMTGQNGEKYLSFVKYLATCGQGINHIPQKKHTASVEIADKKGLTMYQQPNSCHFSHVIMWGCLII